MVRLLSLFPQTPSLHRNGWCWTPVSSSISEKTAVSKLHVYFQFRAYAHRRILEHHALWGKGQSSGVPADSEQISLGACGPGQAAMFH